MAIDNKETQLDECLVENYEVNKTSEAPQRFCILIDQNSSFFFPALLLNTVSLLFYFPWIQLILPIMNQQHALYSIPPLTALVILFIFFTSLPRNLLQAESLFNEMSLFVFLN